MDLDAAYLHAPMEGTPTYIRLPQELGAEKLSELKKSLYGLPCSGYNWDKHVHDALTTMGWQSIGEAEPRLYVRDYDMLSLYVDDIMIVAEPQKLQSYWGEIQDKFSCKEPEQLQKFIGITYGRQEHGR
eukprot:Lankesteria_metandrocarpae@DN5444_c0_g1_i10.p5